MSGYVPSMVLLGGLYLEHRKEKLGKRFDADEAWQEFMQFVKNKQADAWDKGASKGSTYGDMAISLNPMHANPYRKQEKTA